MEDLFNDHAAYARGRDPQTSHDAAKSVNVQKRQAKILEIMWQNRHLNRTWTAWELTHAGAGQYSSISPRSKPLMVSGLVEFIGIRDSENGTGGSSQQECYRLSPNVITGDLKWIVKSEHKKYSLEERIARGEAVVASYERKHAHWASKLDRAKERLILLKSKTAAASCASASEQSTL